MKIRWREHGGIAIILGLFIAISFTFSVVNPLHEATDELRHYRFVRHIVEERSLPVQGEGACRAQGHHPPLFYVLGAAATFWIDTGHDVCYNPPTNPFWSYRAWEVSRDNKNLYLHGPQEAFPWYGTVLAAHIIRGINVLIGAGVVWLTWLIGRAIWPRRPALALGATAFVAFNPMFAYMAGAINNDVIAAFSGTAVVLACVRLLKDEAGLSRRWGIILGALFGLALMSKFNLAAVAVLIEAAVTWVAWRRKQWRLWWQANIWIALLSLLVAGWWFGRNQVLYGEPTGLRVLTELWGVRDPADSFGTAVFELSASWTTLWGRFGYGQIPLPAVIYDGLRWLIGFSLLGLLIPLILRHKEESPALVPLLLLLLDVVLFFGVLFNYLLVSPAGAMGRFFFPALPSLALLAFYGLTRWPMLFKVERLPFIVAVLVHLAMLTLTVVALFGYLAPAYARPPSFTAETPIPNRVDAQFDGLATLRGYELSSESVHPGQPLDIDLYWQVNARPPGNYLLFVHLIDEAGTMVVQRDTHPGLGSFPSSQWRPGDRFRETVRLYIPETAYAPAQATLSIGLYAPGDDGYRLGVTGPGGDGWGDALALAGVKIAPWDGPVLDAADYPNPLDQNFNNEIRLIGYEYSERMLQPGDELVVTLYWQALQAIPNDYIVQVHLINQYGDVLERRENRPQQGRSPTNTWEAGEIIADKHVLTLDPTLKPQTYIIHVSLLDVVTKELQNIVAEDGHLINNHLLLAKIRVRS